MYEIYLSKKKKMMGCDGFSYIVDQKYHRISNHKNNNTPFYPAETLSSKINKDFLPKLGLFIANFLSIFKFYPKLKLQV